VKVLVLVGVTAAVALVTVVPMAVLDDTGHATAGCVAAALCLIPAVGTLLLAGIAGRDDPNVGTTVILTGIGFRFVGVVAGTFLLGDAMAAAGIGRERFAGWVVFFYLITLTAESTLLMWPQTARPDPVNPP
jgi:hypothetical protein